MVLAMLKIGGFFNADAGDFEEFVSIVNGGIRDGEVITRGQQQREAAARRIVVFSNRIHACILVVKANDPRLSSGILTTNLKEIRKYLREQGMTVITVVTHQDKVDLNQYESVLEAASRATGSPANQTRFISNYTVDNCPRVPDTEEQVVKVLQYALLAAERSVKISKQRQQYEDAANLGESSANANQGH